MNAVRKLQPEGKRPDLLSRQELYDLVWAKPITTVAKELGISDVALGKWCRKTEVPLPGRGYWQKVQVGQKVQPTPLPEPERQVIIRFQSPGRKAGLSEDSADPKGSVLSAMPGEPAIPVPATLRNPHPLIVRAEKLLAQGHVDLRRGWLRPHYAERSSSIEIQVSAGALRRGLRIMDALIKGLDSRGFPVRVEETLHKQGSTFVRIENVDVAFGLMEIVRKEKSKDARGYGGERVVPTGELVLRIHSDYRLDAWQLRDGVRRRLEVRLGEFVARLIQEAQERKRNRIEQDRREEVRRIAAEKITQERRKLELEAEELAKLEEMAANWRRARNIREFVGAAREAHAADTALSASSNVEDYLGWALKKADQIDPLVTKGERSP
jgi:hypothetical protein